jgi:hypothetical protein
MSNLSASADAQATSPEAEEASADTGKASTRKQQRLSININQEAADFLDAVTAKRGISYTEAVRRALALYKLLEDQTAMGNHVQIDDGKRVRDLVVI